MNRHPFIILSFYLTVLSLLMTITHPVWRLVAWLVSLLLIKVTNHDRNHLKKLCQWQLGLIIVSSLSNFLFIRQGLTVLWRPTVHIGHHSISFPLSLEAALYGLFFGVMMAAMLNWFYLFSQALSSRDIVFLFGKRLPMFSFLLTLSLRLVHRFNALLIEIQYALDGLGASNRPPRSFKARLYPYQQKWLKVWDVGFAESLGLANALEEKRLDFQKRRPYTIYRWRFQEYAELGLLIMIVVALSYGARQGVMTFYYYPKLTWAIILRRFSMAQVYWLALATLYVSLPLLNLGKERLKWQLFTLKLSRFSIKNPRQN